VPETTRARIWPPVESHRHGRLPPLHHYNFVSSTQAVKTPPAMGSFNKKLIDARRQDGRRRRAAMCDVPGHADDETEEAAMAKVAEVKDGHRFVAALDWMADQGSKDQSAADSFDGQTINLPEQALTLKWERSSVPIFFCRPSPAARRGGRCGGQGPELPFDEFFEGIETFGSNPAAMVSPRRA